MEKATKHNTAPNQRSNANPLNMVLQNLIHAGVCGGGVKALGPFSSNSFFAISVECPYNKVSHTVSYLLLLE